MPGRAAAAWRPAGSRPGSSAPASAPRDRSIPGARGLALPVRLERDANAILLGEAWRGAARGHRNAVLLTLGTGVGGALLVDGAVYRGRDGYAGELGHLTIDPDGPPCGCGNRGCLEAFASGTALRRRTGREGEAVFAAAEAGDADARAAVAEVGTALGIALAGLANVFNPSAVILGGGMVARAHLFWDAMLAEMRRRAFAPVTAGLEVLPARLGDDAGLLGAARLILEQVAE